MGEEQGTYLPLSLPRRWIGDLLHAARNVPLVPFERRMDLSRLAALRQTQSDPPGWCALFTKAFGIVANRRPEFRRCYLPFPWPRLYQHPNAVASVAVEREFEGEPAVFFGIIRDPAEQTLADMSAFHHRFKHGPVEEQSSLRRLVRTARYPRPIRRILWWSMLNFTGHVRARNAGTFAISVTAGLGASGLLLPSPLAFTLNYAPFDEAGRIDVRLHFDHRVIDGGPVARGMNHLEEVLNNDLFAELQLGDSQRIRTVQRR
jgi:hypothetical protein